MLTTYVVSKSSILNQEREEVLMANVNARTAMVLKVLWLIERR
jgi:hypothetical protein